MPHSRDIQCNYCGESSLWNRSTTPKIPKKNMIECEKCQRRMCGDCGRGFLKAMEDTNFIPHSYWKTDDIYLTIYSANSKLHGITNNHILPCCESWEQVRSYN